MPNTSKLIAIAYDLNFRHAAEIFSGASDYLQGRGLDWQLLPLNYGFEAKLMELAASGRLHGAIGTFVSDEWIRGLLGHQVAAINLFNFSKIRTVPTISLDDEAIGRTAAQHLLAQGAKSLTFISQDGAYFNRIRGQAFAESCPPDDFHSISSMALRRVQVAQLGALKAPVGLLCSSDRIARQICNEARLHGMEVGKDLLVIGIGNEPAESTFAGISLSSFDIPAREIGERAIRKMERALDGSTPPRPAAANETIDAKLFFRESTLCSPQARLAERALAAIADSAGQADFDISQLCRSLGVSRRSLELSTRQELDKSPYQLLSETRLNRAKAMLRTTNKPIAKVGAACGLPEPHHFSAWFKQRTKVSPRRYRSRSLQEAEA